MEEMLGNVAGARQVFERWMEWEPDEQALENSFRLSFDISILSLGLALLYQARAKIQGSRTCQNNL